MLKEVCSALKNKLTTGDPLELVDTISGMVQTVSYRQSNEDGNTVTKRFPVSYDTNIQQCGRGPEKDLVPDSSKKGLIYFEENGSLQSVRNLSNNRKMYRGSLLLVCWMNRRKSVGDTYKEVTKLAYDEIMAKLAGVIPSPLFTNLRVSAKGFRQDTAIFGRYSYEEEVTQYLRPPFEFFAIDLNVSFVSSCKGVININPKNC